MPISTRYHRDPYRPDPITGRYPTATTGKVYRTHTHTPTTTPHTATPPQHRTKEGDGPSKKDGQANGQANGQATGNRPDHGAARRRIDRAAQADREDREAHGWAFRSRYLVITGEHPTLAPADHDGARSYLARIELAINHGGWTDNERTRLHRLYRVWSRRASGQDPRFNLYGNRPGGLTAEQRRQLASTSVILDLSCIK